MENDFGKWLKLKLIETGMSQRELAKRLGTTEPTISYYIHGKRKPNGMKYAKIQDLFGTYHTQKEARSITLRQLLYYMTEGDTIQLCFENDGWDDYTELKGNSKLLLPLMDRRIVCMGAEESKDGQAIRVTIANEGE